MFKRYIKAIEISKQAGLRYLDMAGYKARRAKTVEPRAPLRVGGLRAGEQNLKRVETSPPRAPKGVRAGEAVCQYIGRRALSDAPSQYLPSFFRVCDHQHTSLSAAHGPLALRELRKLHPGAAQYAPHGLLNLGAAARRAWVVQGEGRQIQALDFELTETLVQNAPYRDDFEVWDMFESDGAVWASDYDAVDPGLAETLCQNTQPLPEAPAAQGLRGLSAAASEYPYIRVDFAKEAIRARDKLRPTPGHAAPGEKHEI
jgi:hypothetical protein